MAGVPRSPAREQEVSYVIFKKGSYGQREGAKGTRPQLEGLKAVLPKQLLLFYFESRIPARLGTPHPSREWRRQEAHTGVLIVLREPGAAYATLAASCPRSCGFSLASAHIRVEQAVFPHPAVRLVCRAIILFLKKIMFSLECG